jgi:hypothetical protein
MTTIRSLWPLSLIVLATACTSPGRMHTAGTPAMPMAAMQPQMAAMRDMHQKMMNAGTPAERQALMAEHMKAMQGGMARMKEMHAMHANGGGMQMHHPMMAEHMAMMEMMMTMMAERMPAPAP